jgi:hypothetical protein
MEGKGLYLNTPALANTRADYGKFNYHDGPDAAFDLKPAAK